MKRDYLLNAKDISGLTVRELYDRLKSFNGIRVKDIKLSDLIFFEDEPIYSGNGVYVFKYQHEFIYVGSCVARNFIERIPAHFDLRHTGWFNSLLVSVCKRDLLPKKNEHLTSAAKAIFDKASLVLINFDFHKKDHKLNVTSIKLLERILRSALTPYNKTKVRVNLDERISNLIY